ncbi:MAG: alanyl-tRNA editing protein [Candidatus Micrarchaeota archaeon]|nr:alanyl-tRNA editing protein [Candidatus Micrarchaeota archaeon]
MQKLACLEDSYRKECDSVVVAVPAPCRVVLNEVLFYPQGGGQPSDTGKLVRKGDGAEFRVVRAQKENGTIIIEVDKEGLAQGDVVRCVLDWERRHKLMRMHTAAHILANVFYKKAGAQITGNQLDTDKSRFDFSIQQFDRALMEECVREANAQIEAGLDVKAYELPREEAMKIEGVVKLAAALPPSISVLRIVDIGGIDVQADGGTHVRNTREIGTIEVLKLENKGATNKRLYFTLK